MTLFYIKNGKASLYFEHFLKVVYKWLKYIPVLWIKLRKLKVKCGCYITVVVVYLKERQELEEIDKFIVVDLGNTSFLLVSRREMIVK